MRKPTDFAAWFADIANRLLNECAFMVAGARYRIAEVEMYYAGDAHADPFSHRDPLQREAGRWYFHRTGGTYRGGTFKGLDLTLGDGAAYFGILIRTVISPAGMVICGPSLTVDLLLARHQLRACRRSRWRHQRPLHLGREFARYTSRKRSRGPRRCTARRASACR